MDISNTIKLLPAFARRHKIINLLVALAPSSRMQVIPFNGSARLVGDLSDCAVRHALIHGTFEPEFFRIAYPFLCKGGTFFDVGANFGFCTYGLVDRLQETPVSYHLFEASPHYIDLLNKSAALFENEKIHIQAGCVTDEPGTSFLAHEDGSSECAHIAQSGKYKVDNVVLDTYINDNHVTKIEFLKMDIEGFEPFALIGASKALKVGLIDALYIEVASEALTRSGRRPEDCFTPLLDHGYHLFHCKDEDFKNGVADHKQSFQANIHGHHVRLGPLNMSAPWYQTDILALSSNFVAQHFA